MPSRLAGPLALLANHAPIEGCDIKAGWPICGSLNDLMLTQPQVAPWPPPRVAGGCGGKAHHGTAASVERLLAN